MIITKIHMKLRKDEFFDCYEFVSMLQMVVIKELDGRMAKVRAEVLTVYDFAPKMITQNKLRAWENYDSVKRYSFELPIGVAVNLFRILICDSKMSTKAFTSILYHRLINVMDPDFLICDFEGFMPFMNKKLESHGQQV